jgi:hypothetical protein
MSEIAMLLDDQAAELGFESYEEALAKGYVVDYLQGKLVKQDEQEQAHEAWLKEREKVLEDLRFLLNEQIPTGDQDTIDALERAIDFIEKGEM